MFFLWKSGLVVLLIAVEVLPQSERQYVYENYTLRKRFACSNIANVEKQAEILDFNTLTPGVHKKVIHT